MIMNRYDKIKAIAMLVNGSTLEEIAQELELTTNMLKILLEK